MLCASLMRGGTIRGDWGRKRTRVQGRETRRQTHKGEDRAELLKSAAEGRDGSSA